MKKALDNRFVKVFSHPTLIRFECDFEEVCQHAVDNNVLLEVNLTYLKEFGEQDLDKFKRLIEIAEQNQQKVIVGLDAHFLHEIGDDSILRQFGKRIGLNKNNVINNYQKELLEFLSKKD